MKRRRYVLVELTQAGALLLTAQKRGLIRDELAALTVPWDGRQPCELFQARQSLDGNQAIYELTYDDEAVTPDTAFGKVATALEISSLSLKAVIGYRVFGDQVDVQTSAAEARAYLAEHAKAWEDAE